MNPVTFRVLHFLVHASALLAMGMEAAQNRTHVAGLLQDHIQRVAMMSTVLNIDSTLWYFMGCVEADMEALQKLLAGNYELCLLCLLCLL